MGRTAFASLALCAVAGVVACSGGGSSAPAPSGVTPVSTPGSGGGRTAQVTFTVTWPKTTPAASKRGRSYLSNSTLSVTLAIDGGTPLVVNNPNLSPGTTNAFTQSTSVVVSAPVGNDTFVISDFDKAGGAGNLLAAVTTMQPVVVDTANVIDATLDGNLAKIGVAAAVDPFVSGTFPAYTFVGEGAHDVVLTPEDADGNVIIAPGAIPALTLTSATPASVSETATGTTNQYALQAHVPATTVTFTAAGTNLAGTAVTTTFTVATLAAIYVTNQSVGGGASSVTIYPASATGDATPLATLTGSNTEQNQIQFDAVDSNGTLYVTNQGPRPGAVYGPTSGYLTMYASTAQSGNQSPTAMISGLQRPEGVAIDASDDVFVMLERSLVEYPPSPDGTTILSTIGGPAPTAPDPAPSDNTSLDGCYGVAVDTAGSIYAACSDVINVYAKGSNGNVAPIQQVEPLGSTAMTEKSNSWLGIATDSSDDFFAPESNNNLDGVEEFSAGATDGATINATPKFTALGFDLPIGIALDPTGAIYVVNYYNDSIKIFKGAPQLRLGLAEATISGADTGLSYPYGIAVR